MCIVAKCPAIGNELVLLYQFVSIYDKASKGYAIDYDLLHALAEAWFLLLCDIWNSGDFSEGI